MLTKELGAVLPPSHSWMAPLVEDILHDIRIGLTKAVLIGPGRAVLFYERHSLGEGLTADEARHGVFLLTGQVHGLENWPILLMTLWQSKKVNKPSPKL